MMRVLVVSNMLPAPDRPWRGTFVRDQVDDLAGLGVHVDALHFGGRSDRRAYLRAIRTIRARLRDERYDIVHAHYGLTGASAALSLPSVPLVTTFHGSDYAGPAWQRLVSIAVARRSTCIVVNQEGRARLFARDANVIPMGVDTQRFVPHDRAEARRALGWSAAHRYALLAGARADPVKRADVFDAAVERARERAPQLVGVTLEGYDRDQVVLVLNAADVMVLASDREGSPVAVRESLACETPVVAVPVGDIEPLLHGLDGCTVAAQEPGALADGIVEALSAARRAAWRERAEQSSRAVVARRVLDVYESLVPRSSR